MNFHAMNVSECLDKLGSSEEGLSLAVAEERIAQFGENALTEKKQPNLFLRFLAQLNDFMVMVLIAAAVISFVSGFLRGEADIAEPIIIITIVVLNACLGLFQESRAKKALDALKKMSAPTALVIREGTQERIDAAKLVPGDIVILSAGDYVPADARLIEAINLKADESSLTGESLPVDKSLLTLPSEINVSERNNMVFSGTFVSFGRGKAVVTATGMETEVGHIAHMLMNEGTGETLLQKQLDQTGKVLGLGALGICAFIFLIGILGGNSGWDMFMTSVSLAVAAIPEGLPAIVTVMLALGVVRMSRQNAIIRKLPAVETLGATTVICSDKTGTLTQNKMTVVDTWGEDERLLIYAALCNNSLGNGLATEKALIDAAKLKGILKEEVDKQYPRVREIPFDSERKMMTTVHQVPEGYLVITKGAPERIMKICTDPVSTLSIATNKNNEMAEKALRVIAVSYKITKHIDENSLESGQILVGLMGLVDPPRPEVSLSVKQCREAGIKAVMITGDHLKTAMAIAGKIGILGRGIDGDGLKRMTDEELERQVYEYSVFARVTPADKVRIVKAFQKRNAIVAMTGDGVNDAPALKAADIGCAMGSGTDVAKGAADMVLADDNFSTIVSAVREGRGIYSNIRKATHFLLSSNIGEIITIMAAIVLGFTTPLLAIHLLWVNLVTDSLPAIALGLDPSDKDIMKKRPFDRQNSLFSGGLWTRIVLEGLMIGGLSLVAFFVGGIYDTGDVPLIGRTMAFATLSISQLVHAFNMRSEDSIFDLDLLSNPYLIGAFCVGLLLQVSVIAFPVLGAYFKVVPLNPLQWFTVAALSISPLFIVESQKAFKFPKAIPFMNKISKA